ncbi:MAG: hypothetical protein Q9222_000696 [Ikaeria aurantiellina]
MISPAPLAVPELPSPVLPTTRPVPSAPVQTRMKTGPRYPISLKDVVSKTASLKGITVCSSDPTLREEAVRATEIADLDIGRKIKRRLEDLERRASSPEDSPEQVHLDLAPTHRNGQRNGGSVKRPKSTSNKSPGSGRSKPAKHTAVQHAHDIDDYSALFPLQPMRDFSVSPPPQLNYPYSVPESINNASYAHNPSVPPLTSSYPDYQGHSYYLPPLPTTLPSMPTYDLEPMKMDARFEEDGMLSHLGHHMPYTSYGGLEIPQSQSYQDSNVHVNDLFFYT